MTGAVIGRFVLEVSADTRETAAGAETALLPVLQGDSLLALLEECLDELPETADPIWIDEFAVDLGRLPQSIDQDDLRRRAKAAIKEQLATRIAEARQDDPAAVSGGRISPISPLSVLARFLSQGVGHWSHAAPFDVATLVDDAAAYDLPGFRALLRAAMADPYQAQRLAMHLSPEQIARLSVVVAPQAGGLLARLHRVFVEMHRSFPLTDRAAPDVLAAANRALLEAGTRLGSVWISERRVADEFAGSIARNLRLDADSLKSGMVARLRDPRLPQHFARAEAEALLGSAEGSQGQDRSRAANQARGGTGTADSGQESVDPGAAERRQESHDANAVAYFLRTGLPLAPEGAGPRRLLDQATLRRALLSWLPREGQAGLVWRTLRQRLDTDAEKDPARILTRLQMLFAPAEARRMLQRLGYTMAEAGSPAGAPVPSGTLNDVADRQGDVLGAGDRDRDLELFWYLMEFGAIPWWGREVVQDSADRWARAFTADHASRIAGALQAMTENRRALLVERMGARLALEPIAWIVGAASPGLWQETANWFGRLPDIHRLLIANAGDWAMEGQPVPATGQWLNVIAATLMARVFDPHAPVLDWSELQRQVASSVARRLRVPEAALLKAFADGDPDAAPFTAEPGERPLPPGRHHGPTGEFESQAENDVGLVERFISPAAQLTVSVADIRELLADEERWRQAVSRLSAAQIDGLADRLAPGEPLARVSLLLPLEDALRSIDQVWDASLWRQELKDAVAGALAGIVARQSGRTVTAAGLLEDLLGRHAARSGQALPAYLRKVEAAAAALGTVQPAVLAAVALLAQDAGQHSPDGEGGLPEAGISDLPPHYGEDQRSGARAQRRFGQPAAEQVNEAQIVRRFLTLSATAPEIEDVEASVRALLAEPVARASIAAGLPVEQLDRLGERLGMTGGSLLPSEVRALDELLTAAWPGGGGPGWVDDTISAVLAGWSEAKAGPGTGIVPQVRRIMLTFARQEAADYQAILQNMAAAADGGKAASSRVAAAIVELASTAAADAPVRDAGPSRLEADAEQGPGFTDMGSGAAAPAPVREPDASPIDDGPPGTRPASAAPSDLPAPLPVSADWPLRETGSLELADRLLFDAAVAGKAEAKASVRAMLLVPAYRARLSARIESADLDRLTGALMNVAGTVAASAVAASGLLGLGALVTAVAPGIPAAAWRRAVAGEVLRLLAEGPFLSARSAFYRQVLVEAATTLNLEGEAAADWAKNLLDAEGTGGIRIAASVRRALAEIRDAPGHLADGEDAGLAGVLADLREDLDALAREPSAPAEDLANLLERLLAGEPAGTNEFQVAMGIPARHRMVAPRLAPALLDRLGAILLSWDSAPFPSEIANLGTLIARESGQIAPAFWREAVADQLLALVAEAVDERPNAEAMQLVLARSLQVVAVGAQGVPYLARNIVKAAGDAQAGISAPLADALYRIAATGGLPSDPAAETATTEAAITSEARWQSLPLTTLTELFLARDDTDGLREAMASVLQRRLQEPDAALSLRNAFPESTVRRLSEALVGLDADPASLSMLQENAATEAQPSPDRAGPKAGSLAVPERGSNWSGNSLHALPSLVQTLIAMPRTVPPFREVAETIWSGLFSDQGEIKAQDFVSPQTLRAAARILRQAGYLVPDAEGLWDGQSPAAATPAAVPAEEWSLEAMARALLAERSAEQNRAAAEKIWHGLSVRAGRAVVTAAFSLADRRELVRILAAAGYPLSQPQRAGLGLLEDVVRGAGGNSQEDAVVNTAASGEAGESNLDLDTSGASPVDERRSEQQPAPGPRDPDVWPWQEKGEGGSDWTRELLFVEDAGAVLLWPFLVHYFDRIGLLEEGRFASEAAAVRGVMLIHYLATANTATEEPQLVLAKLLCGVPFETPVTPRIDLTEIEETVSDELLNVVCQNWPPLRNSSVEALRETFLLREGSLSRLEERIWVLNVTAKPYDMLLGQLPWTLSTFKTSLMQHPMMVQWGQQ
jgi:hypothetical protein